MLYKYTETSRKLPVPPSREKSGSRQFKRLYKTTKKHQTDETIISHMKKNKSEHSTRRLCDIGTSLSWTDNVYILHTVSTHIGITKSISKS